MRRSLSSFGALLVLGACVPTGDLALPSPPDGAKTMVLVVEPGLAGRVAGVEPRIFAANVGDAVETPAAWGGPGRATVLFYASSLEELVLPPGRVRVSGPTEAGRRLPRPFLAAQAATLDEAPAWHTLAAFDEVLDALRIEAPYSACANAGGCLVNGLCVPCPPPPTPAPPNVERFVDIPQFASCPLGWVADQGPLDVPLCVPGPSDECTGDEVRHLGEAGCHSVGHECPSGQWPNGLPADRPTLFVSPAASPSGDGTRDRPFATLAEALAVARVVPAPGAVIVLGAGEHDASVALDVAVTLFGTCARDTVLRISPGAAALMVSSSGIAVQNLRIVGDAQAIQVAGGGALALDGVVITSSGDGVRVDEGGALAATDLHVRDVVGTGIDTAGELSVSRALFARVTDLAVRVARTGHARLTSVVVRDTGAASGDGRGILTRGRAMLELDDVVVERTHGVGLELQDNARAVAHALGVRDTIVPVTLDRSGAGVLLTHPGVSLDLTFAAVLRTIGVGVAVQAGRFSLADASVRGTELDPRDPASGAENGVGIRVAPPGLDGTTSATLAATLDRVYVEGNAGRGVSAGSAVLVGRNLIVIGPSNANGAEVVEGIATRSSSIALGPFVVSQARGNGALIDARSHGTLRDSSIGDTHGRFEVVDQGHLLIITGSSTITLERYVGNRPDHTSLLVSGEHTKVTVRDFSSIAPRDAGIVVKGGATLDAQRVYVRAPAFEGLRVVGQERAGPGQPTRLVATDVVVEGGRAGLACALADASADLRRFQLLAPGQRGVAFDAASSVDLHDGVITDVDVGIEVGLTNYDLTRLFDGVRFDSVATPFALPAPTR